jgi:hypothetical protein
MAKAEKEQRPKRKTLMSLLVDVKEALDANARGEATDSGTLSEIRLLLSSVHLPGISDK